MEMHPFFKRIQKGLIVSCQAEGDSPFNNPWGVAAFAECAEMGGAAAIRTEGIQNVQEIKNKVSLPLIGLIKSSFDDGYVRITGTEKDVKELLNAGCDMIAIDGTARLRENMTGPEFIAMVKNKYRVLVMADIATKEEAIACYEAGANCISTTLNGYTPGTVTHDLRVPDFNLLELLVHELGARLPIIAEGRYNTPELARQAIESGAWAVVAGTAITRPQTITKWFYDAIKKNI
jgi:N-acylglucosamine-6-phosphate 2-epimerase